MRAQARPVEEVLVEHIDEDPGDTVRRPDGRRPSIAWVRAWVIWFGAWRLVATTVAIVGVAVAGWWLVRPPGEPTEASLPFAAATSTPTPVATSAPTPVAAPPPTPPVSPPGNPATADPARVDVIVHVAGAVRAPGVYELPAHARVDDAIVRAGGLGPKADADAVNRAAPVVDGSQIYVPRPGEEPREMPVPVVPVSVGSAGATPASAADGAGATGPAHRIDVNTASLAELETLPGVGPATGQAIIDYRETNGAFVSVDELEDVSGIGPATLEEIREQVTV